MTAHQGQLWGQGAAAEPPRVPADLEAGGGAASERVEASGECAAEADSRPQASASPPAAAPAPPHAFPPTSADAVPEASAGQPEVPAPPAPPAGSGGRAEPGRHLLRHAVTPEVVAAATAEFGMDKSAAGLAIWELKQPELRSAFARIYRFETRSSNNGWLRGKLLKAVGLDATWIPEQPETPQDADLPQHASQPPPEPAAGAADDVAADAAATHRRPVRQAALAHKPWRASEVAGEAEQRKQRRKRAQHAQRTKHAAQDQHSPAASLSPPPAGALDAQAGAAAASASASASTGEAEQAAPRPHGCKRQLPEPGAGQPGKRHASPDSAQSPAPPTAVAAAALGMAPLPHGQQLAAAMLEAAVPWPSSGSGSTVHPLADAWPRMLAAAACGGAPLPHQVAGLPPQLLALAQGRALEPTAEGELLRLLLQPHMQPGPAQLQPAHWAPWAARGQPPVMAAAPPPGHVAVLGPGGPPAPVPHTWGSRQQLPQIAVMAAGVPQPQELEQHAMQQLVAAHMQHAQAQQHMEAQLLAAGLVAPWQPQALLPVRLAALPAAGAGAAVRPPTPHDSQLQQPAAMRPPHLPQAPQQLGGTVAWLPPGWAAPAQQPWPAFGSASGSGVPLGGCDVQRFREQQLELEQRAQQYRREQQQAAQQAQQAVQQAQQAQQEAHLAQQQAQHLAQQAQQQAQHLAQQAQQQAQQQARQPLSPRSQPVPSPFAAYAAVAPPDAAWLPQRVQASSPAAAQPAGSPRAAGAAASPRALARPAFSHHTLSADLHMLFSAYADGQLSLPLPQAPS